MSNLRIFYPTKIFKSRIFFYLVLLLNLVYVCFTRFYPSMDGPSHLYNANIIFQLVKGNAALSEFFTINHMPVPNWTSHLILAVLRLIFPAWLAEKAFLILYVSGMALSFRYLIKISNPGNISLSILIFPFIYSFLFHLGFYNFVFSFILLFTTFGYWLRHHSSERIYHWLILFLLISLTYFTNLLVFGFLGLTLGLYIVSYSYDIIRNNSMKEGLRFGISKMSLLLLVSLPGLVFMIIFMTQSHFNTSGQSLPSNVLIKWFYDVRPLIVYNYEKEVIYTSQFMPIILATLIIGIIANRKSKHKDLSCLSKSDILLIPIVALVFLFFFYPNSSGAGMMSDRFALMLYIFVLIWVISRSAPTILNPFIVTVTLVFLYLLMRQHLYNDIKRLDKHASEINIAGRQIEKNSLVLPVNLTEDWLEPHFYHYLGIDNPMIILKNYEASVGWFPVRWNKHKMPNVLLGNRQSVSGINWISNKNSPVKRQIDYIAIYGRTSKINDPKWKDLHAIMDSGFKMIYKSDDNYIVIYKKRSLK